MMESFTVIEASCSFVFVYTYLLGLDLILCYTYYIIQYIAR